MTVETLLIYIGLFISSIFQTVIDFRSENADVCLAKYLYALNIISHHITQKPQP